MARRGSARPSCSIRSWPPHVKPARRSWRHAPPRRRRGSACWACTTSWIRSGRTGSASSRDRSGTVWTLPSGESPRPLLNRSTRACSPWPCATSSAPRRAGRRSSSRSTTCSGSTPRRRSCSSRRCAASGTSPCEPLRRAAERMHGRSAWTLAASIATASRPSTSTASARVPCTGSSPSGSDVRCRGPC